MTRKLILSTDRKHDGSKVQERVAHRNKPMNLHKLFHDKKELIHLSEPLTHGRSIFHFVYRRRFRPAYDRRFPRSYLHELLLVSPYLVAAHDRVRLQTLFGMTPDSWLLHVPNTCLSLLRHGHAYELFDMVSVQPYTGQDRCMNWLHCCDIPAVFSMLDESITGYGETGWDRICARSLEEVLKTHAHADIKDDETKDEVNSGGHHDN